MSNDENLKLYRQNAEPPQSATKPIAFGNLKGKTDINPQWRIQAMTEMFGPIGVGWRYEITRREHVPGPHETVALFIEVTLHYRDPLGDSRESMPIVGTGGSMLIIKDKNGLHLNDEAEKMAVTDALSVCFKTIGIGSDVYRGMFDGKHSRLPPQEKEARKKDTGKGVAAVYPQENDDPYAHFFELIGGAQSEDALDRIRDDIKADPAAAKNPMLIDVWKDAKKALMKA